MKRNVTLGIRCHRVFYDMSLGMTIAMGAAHLYSTNSVIIKFLAVLVATAIIM